MKTKLWFITLGASLTLLLVACGSPAATPMPTPAPDAIDSATLNAEGTVVPAQHVTLSFKIGGRVVEIRAHDGDTVKAGAVLARLDDALIQAQIVQAQTALTVAQKQLAQLRVGATTAERDAAHRALDAARAALAQVQAGPTDDQLAQLRANADNAQAAVAQAQAQYDRAGGATNPFIVMTPESRALQQATNNFRAAQAAYRDALSHPTDSEIRAAQSAVAQAESVIARLDPTPEALALAEAQVAQAQAALALTKATWQDTVLTAPFDGTLAALDLELGQVVSPGAPVMTFGDLQNLRVETVDLVEVDVAKIAPGQTATIEADAFPDLALNGKVIQIAYIAGDRRGDKVYQVTLEVPEAARAGLRWGMTTNVIFK